MMIEGCGGILGEGDVVGMVEGVSLDSSVMVDQL